MTPRPIALDACVLLNLLATGVALSELAAAADATFIVVEQAEREVLWLDPIVPGEPRESLDLAPLISSGDLTLATLDETEVGRFVALAARLDDGEAATLALAESRAYVVATDDRKAQRVLQEMHSVQMLTTTAELIQLWGNQRSSDELRACVSMVAQRASFVPPRSDPLGEWWRGLLE